ncbi:MAG: chemotaxis-specific protein-glutamate methyltransferase CheB [Acidiferrobacterales bacterium]
MINVLVVEDSPVVREFLIHVLSADPQICVIGTASDGEEALEATRSKKPDVITMDIHMPKMDGFEATRRIMETHPVPIIIVSGSGIADEVATTFRALEMGALTVVAKPNGIGHSQYETTAKELVETVKLMSEVKVVKRWARFRDPPVAKRGSAAKIAGIERAPARIDLVAIGASTGGPQALHAVLSGLPKVFPAPVLIVQHIAPGFLQGLVDWLAGACMLPVCIARHGESVQPAHVYIAPDGFQMGVRRGGIIALAQDDPVNSHRPSVSYLFRSVADVYGRNAVGVLLTGMGKDGAEELKLMKECGAVTIAQDAQSSVVHGMPGEAIRLDAAVSVLAPGRIATVLAGLANRH